MTHNDVVSVFMVAEGFARHAQPWVNTASTERLSKATNGPEYRAPNLGDNDNDGGFTGGFPRLRHTPRSRRP
jgi:hypothetical protein